jgi:lipoprotein signal peptidase
MRHSRGRVPAEPASPAASGQRRGPEAASTVRAFAAAPPGSQPARGRRPAGLGARTALVVAAVVTADQLAKAAAPWASPYSHGAIVVVQNAGGTVTVAGVELPLMALLSATGLATFGRYAALSALSGRMPAWAVGLLVGGAVSNLLDRVATGVVRDFLATPWVIVNLADLAVLVGLCGVMPAFRPRRSPAPDRGPDRSASAPEGRDVATGARRAPWPPAAAAPRVPVPQRAPAG